MKHLDNNFLSPEESAIEFTDQKLKRDRHLFKYLKHYKVMFPEKRFPKTTKCCWTIRSQIVGWCLKQYFCFPGAGFCMDLSSEEMESVESVGTTFTSGLAEHCTSIPFWIDKDDNVYLTWKGDMYYFACSADRRDTECAEASAQGRRKDRARRERDERTQRRRRQRRA